jgi:hypothetical protein
MGWGGRIELDGPGGDRDSGADNARLDRVPFVDDETVAPELPCTILQVVHRIVQRHDPILAGVRVRHDALHLEGLTYLRLVAKDGDLCAVRQRVIARRPG